MGQYKNKILLFIKVPPPITGATLMNKYVYESNLLNNNFIIRSIPISYSNSIKNLGKIRVAKIYIFCKVFVKLIHECIFHRPQLIYFQISPVGVAFLRDLIFITVIKILNIKILYHLHGKGIKRRSKNMVLKILYKYALHNTELICLSNLLLYDIEDVYNGIVHIVHNGVPPLLDKSNINFKKFKQTKNMQILFLSNLIKSKGILDFIDSLKILSDKNIDFTARIIGAESDIKIDYISELLMKLKLSDKVIYLGPKYGEEKLYFIANSDVLVFPSYYENETFGLVLLEAMQFGVPCITCAEGCIPEIIIDQYNGFIVEQRNPQQISEKLEIFIDNEKLRKKMGDYGRRKYLEEYTLEIFESNMKSVFEDVFSKF